MQTRGERLLQPCEEVPRPELAAVGMARELKMEAPSYGRHRTARLVCEQQPQGRAERRAMTRGLGIAAMGDVEVVCAVVGDASNHNVIAIVPQHDMFVEQHPYVQAPQLGDPGMGAAVVLMVAGNEEGAMA